MRTSPQLLFALCLTLVTGLLAGCGGDDGGSGPKAEAPEKSSQSRASAKPAANVYAATGAGMLTGAARGVPFRIYVPNSESDTVDVVDPEKEKIVDSFSVGGLPQHVTPAPDMRTLYVNSNQGNSLSKVDPRTAQPKGKPVPVEDPYNLYFTLDGRTAIVMAERLSRLDFRDAKTMRLQKSLPVPCKGLNHLDFSADGRYFVASCEFDSAVIKVDTRRRKLIRRLSLPQAGMPQDVKISPNGKRFYVADMQSDGVWVVSGDKFKVQRLIPTGQGAHGLYPSRDARWLFASNREEGSISVIDFASGRVKKKWRIPGGGSPDMGGVSPDGSQLWLSGRYNSEIYGIDTKTGKLDARIKVGNGPHGMSVWPQPGRFSLGHTGNTR